MRDRVRWMMQMNEREDEADDDDDERGEKGEGMRERARMQDDDASLEEVRSWLGWTGRMDK